MRWIAPTLLLLATLVPHHALAQVRHCVAADGSRIYTDRRCESIGASDYRAPLTAGLPRARPGVCMRQMQDLAYALDEAIRAGDTNRVAALYDWTGMGSAAAYRLMERLDTLARRPLVGVIPLHADASNTPADAPIRPRTVGLRVEQTLTDGGTPAHAVFRLRRHLGCWWLRL